MTASARRQRVGHIAFVVAALCFGLAMLVSLMAPEGIDLGQWLLMLDPAALAWLQHHTSPGLWTSLIGPVLVRPAWLLPVMAGAIALTLAWTTRTTRR